MCRGEQQYCAAGCSNYGCAPPHSLLICYAGGGVHAALMICSTFLKQVLRN